MNNMPPKLSATSDAKDSSWIGFSKTREISNQILKILSLDEQASIQERKEIFETYLEKFVHELSILRDWLGYDYTDYENRLVTSEDQIAIISEIILEKYPSLKSLYNSFLSVGEKMCSKTILQQRLLSDCLQPFLYETPEIWNLNTIIDSIRIKEDKRGELFLLNPTGNCLHLAQLDFQTYSLSQIKEVLDGVTNVPYVFFNNYQIHLLENEKLKEIFSHVSQAKVMYLEASKLHLLSPEQLEIIFGASSWAKRVILRDINLQYFTQEMFEIVFGNLKKVVSLSMNTSQLSYVSSENLPFVFDNLTCLRHLEITYNSLGSFNTTSLLSIFQPLENIRSIDLRGNLLHTFDTPRLSCIFDNIPKVQHIFLTRSPDFEDKLVTLFPHLQGKIRQKQKSSLKIWDL